ncbi:MAG: hypothetical protein ACD_79C01448G0003 [uncultured bacterium]|nr:MAG: hypothetical protein ACD_79C01448G0003 [uncultured bacterium]
MNLLVMVNIKRLIMKTYKIRVQEILSRIVKINAENDTQALNLVQKKYNSENIVLDYSDFQSVSFKHLINEKEDIKKKY